MKLKHLYLISSAASATSLFATRLSVVNAKNLYVKDVINNGNPKKTIHVLSVETIAPSELQIGSPEIYLQLSNLNALFIFMGAQKYPRMIRSKPIKQVVPSSISIAKDVLSKAALKISRVIIA